MATGRDTVTLHPPAGDVSDTTLLSARLVRAVRAGDTAVADAAADELATMDPDRLAADLGSDAERIATWVNLYNAAAQRLLDRDAAAYRRRGRFFRERAIVVAGTALSLDAIEHGLLRRSRWKLGLGWMGNPAPGRFERRFRVGRMDPRIHFALNCAAASCPPISAYLPDRLDAQLDLAARSYLAATVRHEARAARGASGVPVVRRRLRRASGAAWSPCSPRRHRGPWAAPVRRLGLGADAWCVGPRRSRTTSAGA
jgi:hypothetical protein